MLLPRLRIDAFQNSVREISKLLPEILVLCLLFCNSCQKDEEIVFPSITTSEVLKSGPNTAAGGGVIGQDGNVEIMQRGIVWSIYDDPTIEMSIGHVIVGEGTGSFTGTLSPIYQGIVYYVRAYAKSTFGVRYGSTREFVLYNAPGANTEKASDISWQSAILSGMFNPNILDTDIYFEYGKSASYTSKIRLNQTPLQGDVLYRVIHKINGLDPDTEYHYRIVAENAEGVSTGADVIFRTCPVLNDIDGNAYSVTRIGSQEWLKEDLRTTKFSDGQDIPNPAGMKNIYSPAYWRYDDDIADYGNYGLLYSWATVNTVRNVCPDGWHVPTQKDFRELIDYLVPDSAAGKMKEAGTGSWNPVNPGANNSSNFSALPGGVRNIQGEYLYRSVKGTWHTSTTNGLAKNYFYSMSLYNNKSNVELKQDANDGNGYSIRCIKGKIPLSVVGNASEIGADGAVLHGKIQTFGLRVEAAFQVINSNENTFSIEIPVVVPVSQNGEAVEVSAPATGLESGLPHYFRLIVKSGGTDYFSTARSFNTLMIPKAEVLYPLSIHGTWIVVNGSARSYESPAVVSLEWGDHNNFYNSQVVIANIPPNSSVTFRDTITGLQPNYGQYQYRVVASSRAGTFTSNGLNFRTVNLEDAKDIDGNSYPTVNINNKTWFTENLATRHFRNNDPIPQVTDAREWVALTSPGARSRSYNFYVVSDPRGLCPVGWHVPDSAEWNDLFRTIDYPGREAPSFQAVGYWEPLESIMRPTNSTAFSAKPDYKVNLYGNTYKTVNCHWWSSTVTGSNTARYFGLEQGKFSYYNLSGSMSAGLNIRCVKD